MKGAGANGLMDTNILHCIMTSDLLLCEKSPYGVMGFAVNSGKSNPCHHQTGNKQIHVSSQ